MTEEHQFYKVSQVAEILQVSVGTVRSWIYDDKLEAYRLTDKSDWRIPHAALKQFTNKRFGVTT